MLNLFKTSARLGVRLGVLAVAIISLTACSNVKEQLGYGKTSPDEFAVVTRAPLSVPPDYALRPPEPGARRPQEAEIRDQARQQVFSLDDKKSDTTTFTSTGPSRSEQLLMAKTDAGDADPQIRQKLDREAGYLTEGDESLLDEVLFWRPDKNKPSLVDPTGEKQRLEDNVAQGKSVTEGETPVITKKDRGILEILE